MLSMVTLQVHIGNGIALIGRLQVILQYFVG